MWIKLTIGIMSQMCSSFSHVVPTPQLERVLSKFNHAYTSLHYLGAHTFIIDTVPTQCKNARVDGQLSKQLYTIAQHSQHIIFFISSIFRMYELLFTGFAEFEP